MSETSALSWLTLAAILVGPIAAVLATRLLDKRAETKRRKYDLFKALMQTRGIRLDPTHVAALNIIELEFYNKPDVRKAFQDYIEHLYEPEPQVSDEDQNHYYNRRSDLFMELMYQVGREVGYNFDKRELDRRSYVPRGWGDDQDMARSNAHLLNQLLQGQRPIPVTNFLSHTNPYPPPPSIKEDG